MKYAIGADIGGTTIKLGIFTENGSLLDKWEIQTDTEEHGKNILPDIAQSIETHLSKTCVPHDDVLGVGLGLPGAVLPNGTVNECINLGWGVSHITEVFQHMTGFLTYAVNDANAAALGETWLGSGKGYESAVMVTLGTGVGAGIVLNGHILTGTFGACGEIGHIPVAENEKIPCSCGKKGCLEQYASAKGLARVAVDMLRDNQTDSTSKRSTLRACTPITAKTVCEHARNGDEIAKKAIFYSMSLLGKALAIVAAVIDPQVFIIGGGLSKSGDLILPSIQEAYKKNAFHASKNTEFKLASLGNDAGIYGAAKLVLNIDQHKDLC